MFTQRQTYLDNGLLSAVTVLLLLSRAGQGAMLPDDQLTTETPAGSISSVTTQINNSSVEGPRVQRSHRSCASEHENYCENGATCSYEPDSETPYCTCKFGYRGNRCLFFIDATHSAPPELEVLIGYSIGAVLLVFLLAVVIGWCSYRRCKKSAPLIKSAPCESYV